MTPTFVNIALTFTDGECKVMSFFTRNRGSVLPRNARWVKEGWWSREASDENIFDEILRAFPEQDVEGNPRPTVLRYRIMKIGEDALRDPGFRGARVDDGERLAYDMVKASAIRLEQLRRERAGRLEELDREWMRASGRGNQTEAAVVEAKRQALRDMPVAVRPALDAAKTIDELKEIGL